MKKLIGILAVFALTLGVTSVAFASDTVNYTVTGSTSTDSGTCGVTDWANDSMTRQYQVYPEQATDGSYRVQENFQKGTFVTVAGDSPGKCEPLAPNNHTLLGGLNGKFHGLFIIKVSGGTFIPVATCLAPCFTADFITAHFGGSATYDVTDFWFKYTVKGNIFCKKTWVNAATGNSGDIATTCTP